MRGAKGSRKILLGLVCRWVRSYNSSMELGLSAEQAELLQRVLTEYISDLRMEVGGTDSFKYRQMLKQDEESLKALLSHLESAIQSSRSS